jgi:hypothetical protein
MGRWVYECRRYPQLQVGPRSAGLRFRDGRFETDDEAQVAALDRLPPEYGVDLVSTPDSGPESGAEDADGQGAEGRPAHSARKADWLAYAQAQDPDADLDGLTKEQLIEQYGGGSDG